MTHDQNPTVITMYICYQTIAGRRVVTSWSASSPPSVTADWPLSLLSSGAKVRTEKSHDVLLDLNIARDCVLGEPRGADRGDDLRQQPGGESPDDRNTQVSTRDMSPGVNSSYADSWVDR